MWPTQAEISRVLGVKPPSVAEWFENGAVPEGRQYQVEIASGGALKADKPAIRTPEAAAPHPAQSNQERAESLALAAANGVTV